MPGHAVTAKAISFKRLHLGRWVRITGSYTRHKIVPKCQWDFN